MWEGLGADGWVVWVRFAEVELAVAKKLLCGSGLALG